MLQENNSQVISKKTKKNKVSILLEIIEEPINIDMYTIERGPYTFSEYIPPFIISTIMKHHFNSSELILSYNDIHGVYKIKLKELFVAPIKNWEYNRPPDMTRCPDIARHIYNSRKPIDTMIYLSFNNIKEIFEVLDGIHRITALRIIKEENSKPIELCSGEFGSENDANWLYEQSVLVNIRFNASLGVLIEEFQNLNKSQNVPELYIRDHTKEKRNVIETIANEWVVKYKKHFSSSSNPNIGNTNRDKFIDLLDKLYEKHKIDESNIKKLRKLLDEANLKISVNIPTKVSLELRVKCKETGCYLFLLKNDILEDFI